MTAKDQAMVSERPRSRCSSRPRSAELKGPERFFYDKTSYTGVHTHGGPNAVDRDGFAHTVASFSRTLRPDRHVAGSPFRSQSHCCSRPSSAMRKRTGTQSPSSYTGVVDGESFSRVFESFTNSLRPGHHTGVAFTTRVVKHPLDSDEPRHVHSMRHSYSSPSLCEQSVSKHRSDDGDEAQELKGPERFFYDRRCRTGVHAHGGPKIVDGESLLHAFSSFAHSLRPREHFGRAFTAPSADHPLDHDRARDQGLKPAGQAGNFSHSLRPECPSRVAFTTKIVAHPFDKNGPRNCHLGPGTSDADDSMLRLREGLRGGSTFVRTAGKPLDRDVLRHIDSFAPGSCNATHQDG